MQLTESVGADRIASAGSASVTVAAGGAVSAPVAFVISNPAVRPPTLTSLAPASALAGTPGVALLINGAGFVSGSSARWNGAALSTYFRSGSQLSADIPAAALVSAGRYSVTVANSDGGVSNAVEFLALAAGPSVSPDGVVNAASFRPAIAPGALISIYGARLAASNAQAVETSLTTMLAAASVRINGIPAPLLFVGPEQINAQVPYEIQPGTARLVVESNGAAGDAAEFQVSPAAPGVIMISSTTHALAVNLADRSLNGMDSPARPGDYIMVYVIGQGIVDHPVANGPAAGADPLSRPLAPGTVKVGGVAIDTPFAALAWRGAAASQRPHPRRAGRRSRS
jgi:uncharacterized protein (TIGR03437 family)